MYVFMGWGGCNATQEYLFNQESIGRSENRADIIQAPHIVQDHYDRNLVSLFKGRD
jgi:hypothetical protein